jgi:phosphopantothenoylcysteine decarboxylase / phosphopantothenate---cysteine ligase
MKILITAGPTYEPIDPVRFIGNRSSGKMGINLANSFNRPWTADPKIVLVLGPTSLKHTVDDNIEVISVETAQEMYEACLIHKDADIIVGCAAVADYRVANYSNEKIKKSGNITLELEKNVDIMFEMGRIKRPGQILVGFALETTNLIEYAKSKITKKNLDIIVANYSTAMNGDNSTITIIDKNDLDNPKEYKEATKKANAIKITNYINNIYNMMVKSKEAVLNVIHECKVSVISMDSEKIVGKLANDKRVIMVYFDTGAVLEKLILGIDKVHNMPIIADGGKCYSYTTPDTLTNLIKELEK